MMTSEADLRHLYPSANQPKRPSVKRAAPSVACISRWEDDGGATVPKRAASATPDNAAHASPA